MYAIRSYYVALDDGVVCDETTATSVPGIVAVGDVARFHNPLFGRNNFV